MGWTTYVSDTEEQSVRVKNQNKPMETTTLHAKRKQDLFATDPKTCATVPLSHNISRETVFRKKTGCLTTLHYDRCYG